MNPVFKSVSKDYSPATDQARQVASDFVSLASDWSDRLYVAQKALRDFVRENVGEPRGFVSRDPLNMSVFGLVFDQQPAAGFTAVPAPVADDLRSQGLRGNAYFPDIGHPVGKQVMGLMNALSRVAEQRPLLNGVPGLAAVVVEGERIVMTRAVMNHQGELVVRAAPSAVGPEAQVSPALTKEFDPAPVQVAESRQTRTMRM